MARRRAELTKLLQRTSAVLLVLIAVCGAMSDSDGNVPPVMETFQETGHKPSGKVDFSQLTSPIIFGGDHKYGFRDPAAVYHEGIFYLYFTSCSSTVLRKKG